MNSAATEPYLESLVALARHLRDLGRPAEAVEAFSLAARLRPADSSLRSEMAQARRRIAAANNRPKPVERLRETLRRDAIDGSQFLGLSRLHYERGEISAAVAAVAEARRRTLGSPAIEALEAEILARRGDIEGAATGLRRALRLDPFDRAVAERLSEMELARGELVPALEHAIDAFLLAPPEDVVAMARLRRRLRALCEQMMWDRARVATLLRERQAELRTSFDRLSLRRDSLPLNVEAAVEDLLGLPLEPMPHRAPGRLAMAARLRRLPALAGFQDEQIFALTRALTEEEHEAGSLLFGASSAGIDLYLIESGEVAVRRPTPYGVYPLATLGPGEILGEVNFLSRERRSGEAVALQSTRVLRFDGPALDSLLVEQPDLGVQLYWTFWHGLARKLRGTNEQLRGFFPDEPTAEGFARMRRAPESLANRVKIDLGDKIRLFREQGLSGQEMETLASFSQVRRYAASGFIFHEAEGGREMYVIVEGQVRIGKTLAGGGEEALAILERGDFFGEMALIDGQPRSADARAHNGPVTVLVLDQAAVHDVLALDPRASSEFLRMLCRLIAKRLREIDEKVTTWRILAHQAGSEIA